LILSSDKKTRKFGIVEPFVFVKSYFTVQGVIYIETVDKKFYSGHGVGEVSIKIKNPDAPASGANGTQGSKGGITAQNIKESF
jgi:hypothetical protein